VITKKNFAEIFEILGSTTRLKILKTISTEEKCVDSLSKKLKLSQPTVSYHLKLLLNFGLVRQSKVAQWARYKLNKEKLAELLIEFFKTYGISVTEKKGEDIQELLSSKMFSLAKVR